MTAAASFDSSIPVLTEVLQDSAPEPQAVVAPEPEPEPAPPVSFAATPAAAPVTISPVGVPPARFTSSVWRTGAAVVSTAMSPVVIAPPVDVPAPPAQDWTALEQRLNEAILQQVMTQVDATIEREVHAALDRLSQDLANHLRTGVRETIAASVAEAVGQQIAQARKG